MTTTTDTPNFPPLAWSNMTSLAKERWLADHGREAIDAIFDSTSGAAEYILTVLEERLAFDINNTAIPARSKTLLPGMIRAWSIVRDMRGLDTEMESMNRKV